MGHSAFGLADEYAYDSGNQYSGPEPGKPDITANVGNGPQWFNQGTANYHGLDVSLTKRGRGSAFKVNYTWGKAIDLNSAYFSPSAGNEPGLLPSPFYRRELNRGVASNSLAHQFNGYYSYVLPFGNGQRFGSGAAGVVDKLIGGWQMARKRPHCGRIPLHAAGWFQYSRNWRQQ